jgi:hypothetical protein
LAFPFLKILKANISKKIKFFAKKGRHEDGTPAWDGRNRVMPALSHSRNQRPESLGQVGLMRFPDLPLETAAATAERLDGPCKRSTQ